MSKKYLVNIKEHELSNYEKLAIDYARGLPISVLAQKYNTTVGFALAYVKKKGVQDLRRERELQLTRSLIECDSISIQRSLERLSEIIEDKTDNKLALDAIKLQMTLYKLNPNSVININNNINPKQNNTQINITNPEKLKEHYIELQQFINQQENI
jgi:hypothetical protein